MKMQKILGLVCIAALAIPMLASAEIYKWKDKNGVMRYSDTPPPTNVKTDTLGSKSGTKPAVKKSPVAANEKAAPSDSNGVSNAKVNKEQVDPKEDAARLRARNAETERRNKLEKEKMAKLNAENCKAAKSNYATFSQGGRIYKTNENGDREYYGDAELKSQKVKAQAEVRKFCK